MWWTVRSSFPRPGRCFCSRAQRRPRRRSGRGVAAAKMSSSPSSLIVAAATTAAVELELELELEFATVRVLCEVVSAVRELLPLLSVFLRGSARECLSGGAKKAADTRPGCRCASSAHSDSDEWPVSRSRRRPRAWSNIRCAVRAGAAARDADREASRARSVGDEPR